MDEKWSLCLLLLGSFIVVWAVIAVVLLLRGSAAKRAYNVGEGFLLCSTGIIHVGVFFGFFTLQIIEPLEQKTLNAALALVTAWETTNLIVALMFQWKFSSLGVFAFEIFHHTSGASLSALALACDVPWEIHLMFHWGSLQHSFTGAHRFCSWFFDLEKPIRMKWRKRVICWACAHDVSKLIVGMISIIHWYKRVDEDFRPVERLLVTACVFLGIAVLINHMLLMIQQRTVEEGNETKSKRGKLGNRVSQGAAQHIKLDTRAIHGLRGFSAVYIALGHFLYYTDFKNEAEAADLPDWPWQEGRVDLHGGWLLSIFYLISGFVMTTGYGQRLWTVDTSQHCKHRIITMFLGCDRDGYFGGLSSFGVGSFMVKRFIRTLPMYFFTNLVAASVMLWRGSLEGLREEIGTPRFILWLAMTASVTTSWVPAPIVLPPNPVSWTVSTMFSFYLAFPILLPYLQRMSVNLIRSCVWRMYLLRLAITLGQCLEVIVFGLDEIDAYWFGRAFPPGQLPTFVMGCCAAFVTLDQWALMNSKPPSEDDEKKRGMHPLDKAAGSMMFFLLFCAAWRRISGNVKFSILARPIGEMLIPMLHYKMIMVLTAYGHQTAYTARFLNSPPLQFLGDISIGIYMIHWPIQTIISYKTFDFPNKADAHMSPLLPTWGCLVAMPISIVAGWLFTQMTDKTAALLSGKKASAAGPGPASRRSCCEFKANDEPTARTSVQSSDDDTEPAKPVKVENSDLQVKDEDPSTTATEGRVEGYRV